jgi:hypothetical protein
MDKQNSVNHTAPDAVSNQRGGNKYLTAIVLAVLAIGFFLATVTHQFF